MLIHLRKPPRSSGGLRSIPFALIPTGASGHYVAYPRFIDTMVCAPYAVSSRRVDRCGALLANRTA